MAIEKDLKRIADSLETIANHLNKSFAEKLADEGYTDAVGSVEQTRSSTETTAPAAPNAPTPPAQTTAPAAPTAMTPEEMNNALVAEFKRIGDRAPIDAAMQQLGVTSVANLTAEQQHQLIATVRAIPGAAA
jgi:hypothetical protein